MEAIVEHIVNLPVEDILHMDMDLEQKIAREFLECQICMDRCQNPKDLDCRHFFCEKCLLQLVTKDKCSAIKCPTCRKSTPVPEDGGVADLPSNFYVRSLADVLKERSTVSSTTTTTSSITTSRLTSTPDSTSTSTSESSSTYTPELSSTVSESTSTPTSESTSTPTPEPTSPTTSTTLSRILSSESTTAASTATTAETSTSTYECSVVDSGEESTTSTNEMTSSMKTCSKHKGKELGMVCMSCTKAICYVCMMESHQQPEHQCKLYQKATDENKTTLTKFQDQLRVSAARGQRCLDAIEENRNILNDNASQVLQAIQTATTESIRAIYSRSDELIRDVKKIQNEVQLELAGLTEYSTVRLEDDLKKLDTIEKVFKNKDGVDIISCAMVMKNTDPSRRKSFKSIPHGVNFVRFVKQELGQEGGLGTLHPLDIVILGRDDIGKKEENESGRGNTVDDYLQASNFKKTLSPEKSGMVKGEEANGTITVDGVMYHEVNGSSGSVLISPQPNQTYPSMTSDRVSGLVGILHPANIKIAPQPTQQHPMAVHEHQGQEIHYQQHIPHIIPEPMVTNTPQPIGIPVPHLPIPSGRVPSMISLPQGVPSMNSLPQGIPSNIGIPQGNPFVAAPAQNVFMRRVPANHIGLPMQNNIVRPVTPVGHHLYTVQPNPTPPFVPRGQCSFMVNMVNRPREPMFIPNSPVHAMRPELTPIRHPCPAILNQPQAQPYQPSYPTMCPGSPRRGPTSPPQQNFR